MVSRSPNLFLVGAPRCGTNSLYTYLRGHPQVFMSPLKEPHFFSEHLFLPARPTLRGDEVAYRALFTKVGSERRIGEASPSYLYDPAASTAIAAFAEDPHIVVTVRHPIDLMFSMYWLRSADALHHARKVPDTFEAALADDVTPFRAPDRASLSYRAVASLAEHIERYVATFGRQRVFIALLEDLAVHAAAARDALCAFLGIDVDPRVPGRVAESRWARSHALARWLWRAPPPMSRLARAVLPASARAGVKDLLRRVNVRSRPPLDPALRRALTSEFAGEIRRLQRVIGRDLSHWLA